MHAQGFDVELKQYPAGWRANFYPSALNGSVVASAYEPSVPLYRRILEWRTRIRHRGTSCPVNTTRSIPRKS
jgi:hypothetical protein